MYSGSSSLAGTLSAASTVFSVSRSTSASLSIKRRIAFAISVGRISSDWPGTTGFEHRCARNRDPAARSRGSSSTRNFEHSSAACTAPMGPRLVATLYAASLISSSSTSAVPLASNAKLRTSSGTTGFTCLSSASPATSTRVASARAWNALIGELFTSLGTRYGSTTPPLTAMSCLSPSTTRALISDSSPRDSSKGSRISSSALVPMLLCITANARAAASRTVSSSSLSAPSTAGISELMYVISWFLVAVASTSERPRHTPWRTEPSGLRRPSCRIGIISFKMRSPILVTSSPRQRLAISCESSCAGTSLPEPESASMRIAISCGSTSRNRRVVCVTSDFHTR
eukprot:comp25059_c0_seq1/m.61179 comp25059_c0_seq1/g.61179  ORF comp25059_c0_seq1/g.61179 comp25059_c0_seq1/m.61179 type:complete len:343 (-) comp25059_c0_seq1:349-1377(-)